MTDGLHLALLSRRALIGSIAASGGLVLSGCDALGENPKFREILKLGEDANYVIHRSLQDRMALAKEFALNERSPVFRSNGTRMPVGDVYARHVASEFRDWTLVVDRSEEHTSDSSHVSQSRMPSSA